MKHKAFPCENSIGIKLQYDKKSGQTIMLRFVVKKTTTTKKKTQTNTIPHVI